MNVQHHGGCACEAGRTYVAGDDKREILNLLVARLKRVCRVLGRGDLFGG